MFSALCHDGIKMVQPIAMLITLPLFNVVGEIEQISIRSLCLLAPTTSNGQAFFFFGARFHVPKNMSVATIPIAMLIFAPNSYVKDFLGEKLFCTILAMKRSYGEAPCNGQ